MRPFSLSRQSLQILVAIGDEDRHGYSILQEVRQQGLRLSPSTLYSLIKRLLEEGLIDELDERPDPDHDDQRRRYYRLTKAGRQAARTEASELERLLVKARAAGLVPKRG